MSFENNNGREKRKLDILNKIKSKFSKALIFGLLSLNEGQKDGKVDTFADRDRARQELAEIGNTREQKKVYKPLVNDLVYRGVKPRMYMTDEKIKDFIPNLVLGRKLDLNEREDAFRIYLGLNQIYDTFGISDYKPTKNKDDKYYFKINNMIQKRFNSPRDKTHTTGNNYTEHWKSKHPRQYTNNFDENEINDVIKNLTWQIEKSGKKDFSSDPIMGNYTWTKGQDDKGYYIAYYDKWDLNIPIEESGFIGKPFEIYDRIYYNPDTFEPIETK